MADNYGQPDFPSSPKDGLYLAVERMERAHLHIERLYSLRASVVLFGESSVCTSIWRGFGLFGSALGQVNKMYNNKLHSIKRRPHLVPAR